MTLLDFKPWRWFGPLAVLVLTGGACSSGPTAGESVGKVSSALAFKQVEVRVTSVERGQEPLDPSVEVIAEFVGFTVPNGDVGAPGRKKLGDCGSSCSSLPLSSLDPWTKQVSFSSPSAVVKVAGQLIIRPVGGFIPPTFQRCFHFGFTPGDGVVTTVPIDQSTCPGGTAPEGNGSVTCSGHTCTAELDISGSDTVPWRFTFDVQAICPGTAPDANCDGVIDGCVPSPLTVGSNTDLGVIHTPTGDVLSLCNGIDDDCDGVIDEDGTHPSELCDLCTGTTTCVNGVETEPCTQACAQGPAPSNPRAGWMNPAFVYDFDVGGDRLCYAPAVVAFGRIGTIQCSTQIGEAGSFPKQDISTADFLTNCPENDDPATPQDETDPCKFARVSVDPNGRAWAAAISGVFAEVGGTLQRVTTKPSACSFINRIELVGPADRTFQGSPTSRPFVLCDNKLFELDLTTLSWVDRSITVRFGGASPSKSFDFFANVPANINGGATSAIAELSATNQLTGLAAFGVNHQSTAVGGVYAIGSDFVGVRPITPGVPAGDPGLISQWTGSALAKVADITQPIAKPNASTGKYAFLSAPTTVDDDPTLSFVHQKIVEGGAAGIGGPSPAGTNDVVWVLTNTSRLYVYNLPPVTQEIRDNIKGDDVLPATAFSLLAPDASPPTALCRNVTIDANASCGGTVSAAMINAGSSDPDGSSVTVSLAHPVSLHLGVNEVELIVSDGTLSSTCWSNVTLRDTTPPALTLPSAVNLKTCALPAAVSTGQATASDACGTPVVSGRVIAANGVTLTPPIPVIAGSVSLPPGTYTVEWSATDGTNTTRANQTVTVSPLIEAGSSFLLDDRAQLKAATGGFGAVFSAGTGATRVGNDAHSAGVLSGGAVDVLHRAIVEGGITSSSTVTVASDASVSGLLKPSTPVTLPALGTLPTFPAPSGSDRIVNANTTLTLSPGSYPSVTVNGSGTLVLGAGDYFFTSLVVNSLSTVRVASTTRIFVKTTLSLRSSFTASGHVQAIFLGFAGSAGELLAPFEGTFLAPAAHVYFGSGVGMTFTGSFLVRELELNPDTVMVCRAG